MTLVDRSVRRQLTAAMALAMALALLLSGTALAQTSNDAVAAVPIDDACNDVPEDNFDDVPESYAFDDEIECLKAYDITKGVGDGSSYAPQKFVPRWQMALFIFRLAEDVVAEQRDDVTLPTPDGDTPFTDLGGLGDQEAINAIDALNEMGVVEGKTSTTYEPFTDIKRDQMASFINRLQDYFAAQSDDADSFPEGEDSFPDDEGNVHEDNINSLANVGIVQGKATGDYDPRGRVTRGQMSAFIMRYVEVNVDAGFIDSLFPGDGVGGGEVTLDQDQAQAGATITGSVEDPGTVQSIAVSGCGFSNDSVDLDGDGNFSLTIPSEQEPGSCELTFTVLRTDGSSTDTTIPFAVTAAPQTFTDAPDLVSATASGDVVTYMFDEVANGITPVVANFRIYDAAGNSMIPSTVEVSAGDQTKVLADYSGGLVETSEATLATIRDGAVEDAAGNQAYASAAALTTTTLAAGQTSGPDLQFVNNVGTLGGEIVADFRFDEEVATVLDTGTPAVGADPAVDPAQTAVVAGVGTVSFQLITSDGTPYTSTTVNNISADDRTLTITFAGAPTDLPATEVVRGVALAGAVADSDGNVNPQQTEPRNSDPAFYAGGMESITDDPDLLSVKVVGDDTVAFEFDESVTTAGITFGSFNLYDSSGTESDGTGATRSSENANVVNVDFLPAAVSSAVGASVDPAAVLAVSDGEANLVHELALQDVSFSAGRTALPDLVSVDISIDAFGDADVVYTFDDTVPGTVTVDDFALVDAQGTRFTPTGAPDVDGDTVTFDGSLGQFTNSQAAAAVIGSVQDETGVVGPPVGNDITEGDVTVSRDTSATP